MNEAGIKKAWVVFAVAVTAWNVTFAATEVASAEKPLRVAVFIGKGARNVGAFRWLQLTTCAKDMESIPVDGAAVRNGALDGADVLVMPGGWSGDEAKTMEAEGREKLKAFVKRGGGYIGTCAGCCLVMESHKTHKDMLHMIPYTFGPGGGAADMPIAFNQCAKEMCGIPKKTWRIRYHGGPVPVPSTPVPEADVKVIATYAGDINTMGGPERKSMAGQAAVIAGTYGKGRLFASAVHPESDVNDHEILRSAFQFVSGRKVAKWTYPQRKRGQLAVGFLAEDSFGIATAKLIQRLIVERKFDIDPINAERISEGALRHLDAVLVPDGLKSASGKKGLYGDNAKRTKEFLGRGGRVFAWGSGAESARKYEPGVTCVADAEAALAALRAFAAEPVPPPAALPAKVPHPLKAAIYNDKDGSNGIIARMLRLSPEYELKVLKAADYANGGLDGIDLLIQPGGSCKGQYEMLGTNGVVALRRYVLEGGRYYGVCAGAFMGAQISRPEWPRLGLVPFKGDDPEHYRGSAPIKVALTEEGKKVFEGSAKERKVIYAGGPALIPGDPVPDTDVKVLATYAGRVINTGGGTNAMEAIKTMRGKAAFVGGRVGKGRVFLSCPHPEMTEYSFDLVRSGIKFLTGVAPSPVNLDRVRGSLAVLYRSVRTDESRAFFYDKILCDRRFDVRTKFDENDYPHVDVIVLASVTKEDDSPTFRQFIANGGQLIAVAKTKFERETAEKITGAMIVDSYDKALKTLENLMPSQTKGTK